MLSKIYLCHKACMNCIPGINDAVLLVAENFPSMYRKEWYNYPAYYEFQDKLGAKVKNSQ